MSSCLLYFGAVKFSSIWCEFVVSTGHDQHHQHLYLGTYHSTMTSIEDGIPPRRDIDTHSDSSFPTEDQPLLRAPPDEGSWKPPRGFTWIQVAIMANVFLYGFDGTITAATYGVISSEFDAANTASWLTTSYLVTSTAFQPLYGRLSDIFGRRVCFFISTVTFAVGCLGCGVAGDILVLNLMRALTGFGGGGLMTMGLLPLPMHALLGVLDGGFGTYADDG